MHERDHKDGRARTSKRRRRMWLIAIVVVLIAVAAGLLWTTIVGRDRRSADERLAEIEAARTIPDAENAAVIYNGLLQDPNAATPLSYVPESVNGQTVSRVTREPWLSRDYPELATWAKEYQFIIDRLFEVTRFEECRFPVNIDLVVPQNEMDRAQSMRQWGFLLSLAANHDLAERQIDAALAKWRCLLQMESHLHQQPIVMDHLVAGALARLALESMGRFIVAGAATEAHLREIEALVPTEARWAEQLQAVRLVEELRSQKLREPFGPLDHVKYRFFSFRMRRAVNSTFGGRPPRSPLDDTAKEYLCTIRGIRILIALKHHRITTSRWPQRLEEVRQLLSEAALTDPISQQPFVYKPAGSTFVLYSKGKNNIDEAGRRNPADGPDDWPIWPPRELGPISKPPDANGV